LGKYENSYIFDFIENESGKIRSLGWFNVLLVIGKSFRVKKVHFMISSQFWFRYLENLIRLEWVQNHEID